MEKSKYENRLKPIHNQTKYKITKKKHRKKKEKKKKTNKLNKREKQNIKLLCKTAD